MLDTTLLDIIVCPNCKGPLKYLQQESQQGQDVLMCEAEQLQYPIRDGIPVLLVDETVSMETKPAASENTPD